MGNATNKNKTILSASHASPAMHNFSSEQNCIVAGTRKAENRLGGCTVLHSDQRGLFRENAQDAYRATGCG